jgi:hypothetical protein
MKMWRCDDCGGYYKEAYLTVPTHAICRLEGEKAIFADPDFELEESWKLSELDFSEVECPDCDGPIRVVEVDTCPHNWKVGYLDKSIRSCNFCGEVQRGEVTFSR